MLGGLSYSATSSPSKAVSIAGVCWLEQRERKATCTGNRVTTSLVSLGFVLLVAEANCQSSLPSSVSTSRECVDGEAVAKYGASGSRVGS